MILKNTTAAYCLNCFKKRRTSPYRLWLEKEPILCDDCLKQIEKDIVWRNHYETDILFLSKYDGLMEDRLMRYKEYGDIALAKAFLFYFLPWIRLYFHGYLIVPLPSSEKRNQRRGFIHLEERLKAVSLSFCSCLIKTTDKQQKEKTASDRKNVQDILFVGKKERIEGKKILLFDDVFTSGSTFSAALSQIRKQRPGKVKGLILMDNFNSGLKLQD